ncbi:MAG: GGDEF domain-containing protein, partial [Gammaproteobacteria bacterium]
CRFGGEEFLIIATNTDGNTAQLLAERIRQAIANHQPKDLKLHRPITASIGVAGSLNGLTDWKELIRLADNALYKVKIGGRNATLLVS